MRQKNRKNKIGFSAMLLSLLGIAWGCAEDDIGGLICMYGTPTASYEVKGKVTDTDGNPIRDAQVTVSLILPEQGSAAYGRPIANPVRTDSDGTYYFKENHFPSTNLRILAEDTDGELNGGEFASDSIDVIVKFVKDKDDKNPWSEGNASVTADIKLKKK